MQLETLERRVAEARLVATIALSRGVDIELPSYADRRDDFDRWLAQEPELPGSDHAADLKRALGLGV
ncbi:MAG TPA: hypothetical protein VEO01_26430 [Pseudonocardiaceae bacterium]|nr:hypothetical protein [Pseudonocardiaceae bacterium]